MDQFLNIILENINTYFLYRPTMGNMFYYLLPGYILVFVCSIFIIARSDNRNNEDSDLNWVAIKARNFCIIRFIVLLIGLFFNIAFVIENGLSISILLLVLSSIDIFNLIDRLYKFPFKKYIFKFRAKYCNVLIRVVYLVLFVLVFFVIGILLNIKNYFGTNTINVNYCDNGKVYTRCEIFYYKEEKIEYKIIQNNSCLYTGFAKLTGKSEVSLSKSINFPDDKPRVNLEPIVNNVCKCTFCFDISNALDFIEGKDYVLYIKTNSRYDDVEIANTFYYNNGEFNFNEKVLSAYYGSNRS